MEIIWKALFWFGVFCLFMFFSMATDPTVRAQRRKRKQENLAIRFHDSMEKGAPRDE